MALVHTDELYREGLLSQSDAARVAGVSVTQVRKWQEGGVLTPRVSEPFGSRTRHLYAVEDVEAVMAWGAEHMSENEAAKALRVDAIRLPHLVAAGRIPEPETYLSRRVYSRSAVQREEVRRARLISEREVARRFDLPYWVLRGVVDDGLLPFESGAKGAYLIDPHDLKPLLECNPCRVCGDLLAPGRRVHGHCHPQTPDARQRTSDVKREFFADTANRANISEKRRAWWQSPEADRFRAKLVTMPCPECQAAKREWENRRKKGKLRDNEVHLRAADFPTPLVTRSEAELGDDLTAFCGKACATRWRWRHGIGVVRLVNTYPPATRGRHKRRWSAPKGAVHARQGENGLEGRAGGRPAKISPDEAVRINELLNAGVLNNSEIARRVFGDQRFHQRVRNFRRR